ncbi:MAG: MFS transporter [Bacteroidota bacterium]|nr:MFS transporter [Bacteroidota bacterium]
MTPDPNQTNPMDSSGSRLRKWQKITIGSLCIGYAGYYLCRSNLSVVTPLLLEEFGPDGLDKEIIGLIASSGVLFYAVGKVLSGIMCDFFGGRRTFLLGMIGSIVATVLFGLLTGVAVFMIIWSANRLIQSTGWVSLVKITSNWFPFGMYGTVMGILSLSFLFGDVLARLFLGSLITAGIGWRGVFFAAAAGLTTIAVGCHFLLRSSPTEIGEKEPEVNPQNLYGSEGWRKRPMDMVMLLRPLLSSFSFWMVATMSLGLTLIRETFNIWTPTYLAEVAGLSAGSAATYSLLFPLFGGISVLIFGRMADRLAGGKRSVAILAGLVPLVAVLGLMGGIREPGSAVLPLVLVSAAAMLMIGPYSFLAGAISLDLGGKVGSSTASGLIDAAGYLGAIASGVGIGSLAQRAGWDAAFGSLAVVALLTVGATIAYWRYQERQASRKGGE